MKKTTWFHGSSEEFEKFDPQFIGGGIDQYGVGFYFAESREIAEGYAGLGYLYSVEVNEDNVMISDNSSKCIGNNPNVTKDQIRELLTLSPDFKETIWNFGDIGNNGEHTDRILEDAIETYSKLEEPIYLFNCIANDWYDGHEGLFALKIKEKIGLSGIEIRGDGVAKLFIAFDSDDIEIQGTPERKIGIESILESNTKIIAEAKASVERQQPKP